MYLINLNVPNDMFILHGETFMFFNHCLMLYIEKMGCMRVITKHLTFLEFEGLVVHGMALRLCWTPFGGVWGWVS